MGPAARMHRVDVVEASRAPRFSPLRRASEAALVRAAQRGSERAGGSWSPHGRFVVAWRGGELLAVEPGGRVRWSLARRGRSPPRAGRRSTASGSPTSATGRCAWSTATAPATARGGAAPSAGRGRAAGCSRPARVAGLVADDVAGRRTGGWPSSRRTERGPSRGRRRVLFAGPGASGVAWSPDRPAPARPVAATPTSGCSSTRRRPARRGREHRRQFARGPAVRAAFPDAVEWAP